MLTRQELQKIARARLEDAQALFKSTRYDGSIYLCGYAIEIGLKNKICKTLRWKTFPSSRSEFQDLQSFKTHSLDVLLRLSGAEDKIKKNFFAQWSIVRKWDSEARYKEVGSATEQIAESMIEATKILLGAL
jgi:HEPN domain-containing protein